MTLLIIIDLSFPDPLANYLNSRFKSFLLTYRSHSHFSPLVTLLIPNLCIRCIPSRVGFSAGPIVQRRIALLQAVRTVTPIVKVIVGYLLVSPPLENPFFRWPIFLHVVLSFRIVL